MSPSPAVESHSNNQESLVKTLLQEVLGQIRDGKLDLSDKEQLKDFRNGLPFILPTKASPLPLISNIGARQRVVKRG